VAEGKEKPASPGHKWLVFGQFEQNMMLPIFAKIIRPIAGHGKNIVIMSHRVAFLRKIVGVRYYADEF
jgi:hypothetical protein